MNKDYYCVLTRLFDEKIVKKIVITIEKMRENTPNVSHTYNILANVNQNEEEI